MRKLFTSFAIAAVVAVAGFGITSNAALAGGGHHNKHKHHHGKHHGHKHHYNHAYWGLGLGGLAYYAYSQPQVQYVPTPVYPSYAPYDPYAAYYYQPAPTYYYAPAPTLTIVP